MANIKVLVGGVILVGTALVAEPIVVSFLFQDQINAAILEIDKHPMISVTETKYERGLFGGQATTKLQLVTAPKEIYLILKHDVSTIPFISLSNGDSTSGLAHIRTSIEFSEPKNKATMLKMFSNSEPVIDTVISFSGDIKAYLDIPEINVDEETGIPGNTQKKFKMKISGLHGSISVTKDRKQVKGLLRLDLMSFDETYPSAQKNNSFEINDINSHFNATKITENIYSGEGNLKIAQIDIKNAFLPVSLSDNDFSYRLINNKETLDYHIDLSINKITSSGGFPLPINTFASKGVIRNIDIQAFEQYIQIVNSLYKKDAQDMAKMGPQMAKVGDLFLKRNIMLEQKISLGSEKGNGNIDMIINFKALDANMSVQTMNPIIDLVPRASADLKIKLPKAMVAQTPLGLQVAQFIQAGYVKEETNDYISHAEFKDSKLTVNGKVIPIPFLPNQSPPENIDPPHPTGP